MNELLKVVAKGINKSKSVTAIFLVVTNAIDGVRRGGFPAEVKTDSVMNSVVA